MELGLNPRGMADIDDERERREEMMAEMAGGITSSDDFEYDEEEFDAKPSEELEALLPYYNQVEDEALKLAKKSFEGTFIADYKGPSPLLPAGHLGNGGDTESGERED